MRLHRQFAKALVAAWLVAAFAAGAAESAVAVHLEIRDDVTASGLVVSIRRETAQGSTALAFMESVVAIEYKRYPSMGVFVTSLCGVSAPDGMFWALSVNGERSTRGIADVALDADTRIRWDLEQRR